MSTDERAELDRIRSLLAHGPKGHAWTREDVDSSSASPRTAPAPSPAAPTSATRTAASGPVVGFQRVVGDGCQNRPPRLKTDHYRLLVSEEVPPPAGLLPQRLYMVTPAGRALLAKQEGRAP